MTVQHRNAARMMKRQVSGFDPGAGPGGNGGPGNNGNPSPSASNPGNGPSSSDDQTPSSTSSKQPPQNTATPSSTPEKPSTTAKDTPTTTSTSSSTESSTETETATTSSSSSTSSTTSSTSTSTVILTAPAQIVTPSASLLPHTTLSVGTTSATPSASASAAPSSGVKVGTIVGGIAGALVGLAVLGLLTSFILRRMRKRNRRDTILGDDFRNSQFFAGAGAGTSGNHDGNDDALEPPSMTERHHSFAPSVASSPGMAGHGAFQSGATYDTAAAPAGGYGATGYGATAYGAAGAAAATAGALQERPRYAYGQHNNEEVDDMAHGVYSSQPQPQVSYNPEAYGSYAAYGATAGAGYQEATREYQGQHGGYDQNPNDPFNTHARYGVAVADPGPATSSVGAGAHPSAARDPASLSGSRGENTRSVAVQDDDVYGGI